MALGFTRSTGEDFLPILKINSVSGEIVVAGSTKSSDGTSWDKYEKEVKLPTKLIFDMADIKVGFISFTSSGPSFALVKIGEPLPAKPTTEHKPGFQVVCYSKEYGKCVLSNSSKTVGEAMDLLHDQFLREEKANAGKVPVVSIAGMEKFQIKTKEGSKSYKRPVMSITSWVARPEEMMAAQETAKPEEVAVDDDGDEF